MKAIGIKNKGYISVSKIKVMIRVIKCKKNYNVK